MSQRPGSSNTSQKTRYFTVPSSSTAKSNQSMKVKSDSKTSKGGSRVGNQKINSSRPSQELLAVMKSEISNQIRQNSQKVDNSKKNLVLKSSTQDRLAPSGIIDDVLSTGKSIAKTVSTLAEGNPMGLLEIPNSIMKVIDTTKNIIRNVSETDAKAKVILPDKTDITSVQDTVLMEKLSEGMPVVTTTQLPSSYAVEHSMPTLRTYETVYPDGRKGIRVVGSYSLPTAANTTASNTFIAYDNVLNPSSAPFFGSRLSTLSDLFQMYKFNNLTAQWIPTVGTDYPGNMIYCFSDGTDVAGQWAPGTTYQQVSQRDCIQPASVKQGSNLTVKGKGDWLYVYDTASDGLAKFYASQVFGCCFYNVAVATSPVTQLGHFFITFDLEFKSNMETSFSYNNLMRRSFFSQWVTKPKYSYIEWIKMMWNISKRMPGILGSISKSTQALILVPMESEITAQAALQNRYNILADFIEQRKDESFSCKHTTLKGKVENKTYNVSDMIKINTSYDVILDPWIHAAFLRARDNLIRERVLATSRNGHPLEMSRVKRSLENQVYDFLLPTQYAQLCAHVLMFFKDTQFIIDHILSEPGRIHKLLSDVLLWIYRQRYPKLDIEIVEPNSDSSEDEDEIDSSESKIDNMDLVDQDYIDLKKYN